jgi:hypothetical protein
LRNQGKNRIGAIINYLFKESLGIKKAPIFSCPPLVWFSLRKMEQKIDLSQLKKGMFEIKQEYFVIK